jgi:hypothetical protein
MFYVITLTGQNDIWRWRDGRREGLTVRPVRLISIRSTIGKSHRVRRDDRIIPKPSRRGRRRNARSRLDHTKTADSIRRFAGWNARVAFSWVGPRLRL